MQAEPAWRSTQALVMDKIDAMNKPGNTSGDAAALAPQPASDDASILRKKLRWRAWHRGTQELDLMLGTFADRYLETMDLQTLHDFELFMLAEDPEIQAWLQGDKPFPSDVPEALAALFAGYDFLVERQIQLKR